MTAEYSVSTGKDEMLSKILTIIEKSDIALSAARQLALGKPVFIKPAGRLFLELLAIHLSAKGNTPVVFILENEDEMLFLREELKSITGKEVGFFLPFAEDDSFSMDEVEERLLTLDRIISKSLDFIITSSEGISCAIPTALTFKEHTIQFRRNAALDFLPLAERLSGMGFNRVMTVGEVGEFSIRGSIVDIYGYGMDFPKRVEFRGDTIVSIRSFDTCTQRTVSTDEQFKLLPLSDTLAGKNTETIASSLPSSALFVYSELLILEDHAPQVPDIADRRQLVLAHDGIASEFRKPMEFHGDLSRIKAYLGTVEKDDVAIFCESDEERRRGEFLIQEEFPGIVFSTFNIGEGIESDRSSIHILTDKELFGKGFHPRKVKRSEVTFRPENLSELKPGDFVVHEDYGIALFEKIGTIEHQNQRNECLVLRYEHGDKLYVPIAAMGRVSKYVGLDQGVPKLSNLTGMKWERKKKSARKAIADMTDELLKLYAARAVARGFSYSPDTIWQKELEARFPYEETEDQLQAIREIKQNMESLRPMDRLVCGEVGYGKTEVAIRASFKAVMDSKQVIFLAPTTVLCEQHYHTFNERLKGFPLRVAMLSRFVKKGEQKKIVEEVRSGAIDIIIGTQRLLSKDMRFYNPGLLIIDEEHRFGVSQKERLKQKRKEMDVLSMSATPIPRTLQFSLLAIRDFSTIETPPKGRLSVSTRIIHWNSDLIREVILSEIRRGGQVFFVHNRIQTLTSAASRLRNLVPEAKIAMTHGRMQPALIERRMLEFLSGKSNVLVTTSIIESGLDIPNANTIIVDRADTYGIAQLHQLRGRVGRSNRRAYCYLIIPHQISHDARKRLSTIYTHSHLGSGLALAMKDLEIRGAGNLLGRKQHGHIVNIGYDLYMKLLQETIQELKGEKAPTQVVPEVFATIDAYLPPSYVPDDSARIDIYRRLSTTRRMEEIEGIAEELVDRFGALPPEATMLLLVTRIKVLCTGRGIKRVSIHERSMELWFTDDRSPNKKSLEALVREMDKQFFMDYSEGFFRMRFDTEPKKIIRDLKKILQFFA